MQWCSPLAHDIAATVQSANRPKLPSCGHAAAYSNKAISSH